MKIDVAYLVFTLCALGVFKLCKPTLAVLIVFLGGWVLLPIGHFPTGHFLQNSGLAEGD
jgi:hypothetical protein